MELHQALLDGDLTTLRLLHDWRDGRIEVRLTRDWNENVDFGRYVRDFQIDELPLACPRGLGDADARRFLHDAGAGPALAALEELVRAGRHEMIVLKVSRTLAMRSCNAVHSSVLGRNNGFHAIRAGGIRRHEADEPEHDVLIDGLNLGRAMSFKNAAADIPFGGNKMTWQCEPVDLEDEPRLGFIAYCIDSGHFMTGPDMGFPPELSDAIRARFTKNILGGPRGAMGPTGTPTAEGCFLAILEAAQVALGGTIAGRTVALQGVGAVGLPLAERLARAGAKLSVADPDEAAIRRARERIPGVEIARPEEILTRECDVLSPCAHGAVLDEQTIDALACRMVYGSANNQLAAVSQEEELALAERIAHRGVLYQPDWTHNTAGVMAGYEEYLHQEHASPERLKPHLERVCRDGTRSLLAEASATGRTPTALAYERVERRIYPSEPQDR